MSVRSRRARCGSPGRGGSRLQEARDQGWLGEVAAIETTMAAAAQKLEAMRERAAQPSTVHLGMPDIRSSVGRITPEL